MSEPLPAATMRRRRFSALRGGAMARLARDMVRRADAARDAGRHREAATLYDEALRIVPGRYGVLVQSAHMLKELGDHAEAERRYLAARDRNPRDADLAYQVGHFYRCTGRIALAKAAYADAVRLAPDWPAPRLELDRLTRAGWGVATPLPGDATDFPFGAARPDDADHVVPELLAPAAGDTLRDHGERIEIKRLGRAERTHWGVKKTLRGIEALRGYCMSAIPIAELQVQLNGELVHRAPLRGGYPVALEGQDPLLRKYVFNIWFDFTGFADGLHEIEFRFLDTSGRARSHVAHVAIARPLDPAVGAASDGFVPPAPGDASPLAERIDALPSMIRPGRRAMLPRAPRTILVQRADQLGDLVVSVPAIRRLREMFAGARLVGLVSNANRELAASLGLFDEIVSIDFPEDRWSRRRVLPAHAQADLRKALAAYEVDLAIDLSESEFSRYLLLLADAPILVGFRSNGVPSLTVEIEGNTHDRLDGHEIVPHTNKQLGIVEWLGAMVRSEPNLVRRGDGVPGDLSIFDLDEDDRFVVFHDGARLQHSRWPHYAALAELVLARTDLKVVLLTDDAATRDTLPPSLATSDRFRLVDGRVPFDSFDTLLARCAGFVGNDSGPKHLASFRGAKVVSIHMARNNWNEWGQENGGYIISRRVPCAGCLVNYDPEECGRDFVCVTRITPEEVFGALMRAIAEPAADAEALR